MACERASEAGVSAETHETRDNARDSCDPADGLGATMTSTPPPVTDLEGLFDIARDLMDSWEAFVTASDEFTFGQRDKRPDEGRFITVYGLAAHVHSIAQPTFQMLKDGLVLEACPLVRLMYESALYSVWLAQNEDGARAFMNKEIRARKAIAETLGKASAPWLRDRADQFPGIDDPAFESGSDAQAKNFEALCDDLTPGGADAYINYRLLSRLAHASPQVLDRYTYAGPDGDFAGLRRDADRDRESPQLITFYACASLVWAGAAVDYIDPSRTRRSDTRRAARSLGIPRDLHLTYAAQRRINAALAEWKRNSREAELSPEVQRERSRGD